MAVVDLGSRRRTLLFLRADQLGALRFMPGVPAARPIHHRRPAGDAGHPGPRAWRRRASSTPPASVNHLWAVVHFTVRLPDSTRPQDVDTSLDNETRIQNLLTEAARTWGDRLLGAVKSGSHRARPRREHYSDGIPRGVQAGYRTRWTRSTTSRSSKSCRTIRSNCVYPRRRRRPGIAQLTWYLGGRSASLSAAAADAAVHGRGCARRAAVHRDPARRACRCGSTSSRFRRTPPCPSPPRPRTRGDRAAVRRRGHRDLAWSRARSTGSTSWCCARA